MPLTCAFDLMDFDMCSNGGGAGAGHWGSTTTVHSDYEPIVVQFDKDIESSVAAIEELKSGSQLACGGGGGGATNGERPSPMSSSSLSSSGLSSSSYCRRIGSAAASSTNGNSSSISMMGRRSGAAGCGSTFQLWSPRLRMRDERKRVLKLSLAKLRRIDDAESCLRRSVLLNNTLRRLQREVRDEKSGGGGGGGLVQQQFQQLMQHTDGDTFQQQIQAELRLQETTIDESESASPIIPCKVANKRRRSSDSSVDLDTSSSSSASSVVGVFNDLYLPPTPRMLSSLEDDEVVDDVWHCVKRAKMSAGGGECANSQLLESSSSSSTGSGGGVTTAAGLTTTTSSDVRNRPALRPCNSLSTSQPLPPLSTTTISTSFTSSSSSTTSTTTNQNSSPLLVYGSSSTSVLGNQQQQQQQTTSSSSYSCGQSSLFGELQSVVFHSLITSLES